MQPDVPPDFFWIVDATGLHQELEIIFVLGERFERIRNSSAGKTFEHFQSITLESGVLPNPKRGVDRERINVRQKISDLVHHVDCRVATWNSHMHVQSEN